MLRFEILSEFGTNGTPPHLKPCLSSSKMYLGLEIHLLNKVQTTTKQVHTINSDNIHE